jgi:cytochrome oxidase Cu insertion factor (SCO1/SenC/PrrC family)
MHDLLEVFMLKLLSACAGFLATSAAVLAAAQTAATPPNPVELKVGDTAPAFALQGSDGKIHKLSDYAGKYVVLAWFPKAFTGG